jgi:hypothetical protein
MLVAKARLRRVPHRVPSCSSLTQKTLRLTVHRVDGKQGSGPARSAPCRACSTRVATAVIPLVRDAIRTVTANSAKRHVTSGTTRIYPSERICRHAPCEPQQSVHASRSGPGKRPLMSSRW